MTVSFSFVPEFSFLEGNDKKGEELRKDLKADPFVRLSDKAEKLFLQQEFNEKHRLNDCIYQPKVVLAGRSSKAHRHLNAFWNIGKARGLSIPPAAFWAFLAQELHLNDLTKLKQSGITRLIIPNRVILKTKDEPVLSVLSLNDSEDRIVLSTETLHLKDQKSREKKLQKGDALVFLRE